MHMPSGQFEILPDPQLGTGSQPRACSLRYPRWESHFLSTPIQRAQGDKALKKLTWWECQNLLGEQDLLFCLSSKQRIKEMKDEAKVCN